MLLFFLIFMDLYRIFFDSTYRNTTDENTLDSTNRGNLESSNSPPKQKPKLNLFFPKMELTYFSPELKIYK